VFLDVFWLIPIFAVYATIAWFVNLYRKDKDKRKLMFSIVFFFASIDYIFMLINAYPNPNTTLSNFYLLSTIPLQMAIFLAVIETLHPIKNFDRVFNIFFGVVSVLFILSLVSHTSFFPLLSEKHL